MKWRLVAIEVVAAVFLPATASADTLHFAARLSGLSEAPAIRSSGVGELWADLDTHSRLLTYRLTYQGLSGPATAARLQGPAKTGQTAPATVAVSDTSNPITGEAMLTAAQAADLKEGLWYVNIATTANPEGEIRGQVKLQVDADQVETPVGPPPGGYKEPRPASDQLSW
ncbi:MAG: CHRD domain-containing protein [Caulobacterales bacterium]